MRRLHVISQGKIYSGASAFIILWKNMPRYRLLSQFFHFPFQHYKISISFDQPLKINGKDFFEPRIAGMHWITPRWIGPTGIISTNYRIIYLPVITINCNHDRIVLLTLKDKDCILLLIQRQSLCITNIEQSQSFDIINPHPLINKNTEQDRPL